MTELVEVAYANGRVEAELIQGLLESGGIPSLLQPTGLNGPQVGVVGLRYGHFDDPQRVMVHAERAEEAHALLAETMVEDREEAWPDIANAKHLEDVGGRKPRGFGFVGGMARIYLWSFGAMALFFGAFMLLRAT